MQPYNQMKSYRNFFFLAVVLTITAYACEPSQKAPDNSQPEKAGVVNDTSKTQQAPPPPVKH
jgi:hypothetical protein